MRKNIFTTLKTLMTTARTLLYTGQARAAKPNVSRDQLPSAGPGQTHGVDDWMFAPEVSLKAQAEPLASDMRQLSSSLTGLRQTLTHLARPIPVATLMPCAIHHHDSDLFDGEVLPLPPIQDTTIGGDDIFLFDEAPAFDASPALHAA